MAQAKPREREIMTTTYDPNKSYTNRALVGAYWAAVWADDADAMGEVFTELYRRVYARLYNAQPEGEGTEPHARSVALAILDEGFVA